jgi:hypothetical protein
MSVRAMSHVEEREYTFRLELRCEFPDEYDGDADGYVWTEEFRALAGEMLRAMVTTVARHPGWKVRPANRGRSSEDEVTLVLERVLPRDASS